MSVLAGEDQYHSTVSEQHDMAPVPGPSLVANGDTEAVRRCGRDCFPPMHRN